MINLIARQRKTVLNIAAEDIPQDMLTETETERELKGEYGTESFLPRSVSADE